jgi:glycosyltransferase involved in cell wall biosynthesis
MHNNSYDHYILFQLLDSVSLLIYSFHVRKSLSVAVISKNEAANLPRALESVHWADEIVVVDSGSTDATLEIARKAGARVFEEPWMGYAQQKNLAIALSNSDWILSLDADEEVSAELAGEIQRLLAGEPAYCAYRIPRRNHFLGKALHHGGYWPDLKLRLFRAGAARFEDRLVHETMKADGPTGRLSAPLLHHCYPTMDEYIEHMNRYSAEAAQMQVKKGRMSRSLPAFLWNVLLNPVAAFSYKYIVRMGFLDGREGLLMHLNHSVYVHWKFVKAWRMGKSGE